MLKLLVMPVALVQDIVKIIEGLAPSAWAEDWDNAGLQIGSAKKPVDTVFVAVDPTLSVLDRAIKAKAQLIITHHPLFFHPLRQVSLETPIGRIITRAIEANISIYSAHTNLDIVPGGINTALTQQLGLQDLEILAEAKIPFDLYPLQNKPAPIGYGCVGTLKEKTLTFKQFIAKIKRDLHLSYLQMVGKPPTKIRKVAVCGGSGSQLVENAYQSGADIYLTAELKHSHARVAEELNFCVLDIGHFHSEKLGMKGLAAFVREKIDEQGLSVRVIEDQVEKSPLQLIK